MQRLAGIVSDHAFLAIVEHGVRDVPWREDLVQVVVRHSRNPDFDPRFSLVDTLSTEGHFELARHTETVPILFQQPVKSYVEQFHSTATLARELMSKEEAATFDLAVEEAVKPWSAGDVLEMKVVATVAWGRPRVREVGPQAA
jgi:hypothetical protein